VTGATCGTAAGVAHYDSSLKVSGTVTGGGSATYAYRVFDLSSNPVPLDAQSSLSYFVHPQADNGRYVAVDLHFTDGTFLSAAGLKDQNGQPLNAASGHGGAIPLGMWSLVTSDLSSLAGKSVDRVDVVFSRASATGNYLAYVDDILLTSATKPVTMMPQDAGPIDASAPAFDAETSSVPEASAMDATASMAEDSGTTPPTTGGGAGAGASSGCGCRTAGESPGSDVAAWVLVASLALLASRRRQ
jgi:MYXO-CTERM domain-containing protein